MLFENLMVLGFWVLGGFSAGDGRAEVYVGMSSWMARPGWDESRGIVLSLSETFNSARVLKTPVCYVLSGGVLLFPFPALSTYVESVLFFTCVCFIPAFWKMFPVDPCIFNVLSGTLRNARLRSTHCGTRVLGFNLYFLSARV